MTDDKYIELREKNHHDLSKKLYTYVTIQNIDNLSAERVFIAFIHSIDALIEMDASDYADNFNMHPEWVAGICWERMHPEYREQILAAIPHIQDYMRWGTIRDENSWSVHEFIVNAFSRVVHFEKAEIIKRAQTKMLKEEIAMKVMHPARIEKLATTWCMTPSDYMDIID